MTRPDSPNNFQAQAVSDTFLYNEGNEPSSGWQKGFKSGGTLEKRSNTLFLSVGSSSATQEAAFEHLLDVPNDFHFADTFKVEFTTTTQGAPKFGGALPSLGDQPSNSGTSGVTSVNRRLGNRNSQNPNAVAISVRDGNSKSAVNSDMTVSKVFIRQGGSREVRRFWLDSSGVDGAYSIEAGPNNKFVYTGYSDNNVRKLNVSDGSLEQEYQMTNNISDISISPDGNFVYATDNSGILRKINASSGNIKWEISNCSNVSAGPDGNFVYKSGSGNVKRLDATDGSTQWTTNVSMARDIDIGLAGNSVYGVKRETVTGLDASNGNVQFQLNPNNPFSLNSVRAGPNGDFLYTGNNESRIKKRDGTDASVVWTSNLQPSNSEVIPIGDIVVGPKNDYVYGRSRKVALFGGFSNPRIRKIIPEDGTKVWDKQLGGRDIEISPSGSFLYAANRNGRLGKYNAHVNED